MIRAVVSKVCHYGHPSVVLPSAGTPSADATSLGFGNDFVILGRSLVTFQF